MVFTFRIPKSANHFLGILFLLLLHKKVIISLYQIQKFWVFVLQWGMDSSIVELNWRRFWFPLGVLNSYLFIYLYYFLWKHHYCDFASLNFLNYLKKIWGGSIKKSNVEKRILWIKFLTFQFHVFSSIVEIL